MNVKAAYIVLIISAREDFRKAFRRMLYYMRSCECMDTWSSISHFPGTGVVPDIVLMDIEFYKLLYTLPQQWQKTKWIMLVKDDTDLLESLYAGASAFYLLNSDPEDLPLLIDKVAAADSNSGMIDLLKKLYKQKGNEPLINWVDYGLTPKEKNILLLMREGNHLKAIAQKTSSTYETVRTHVKRIYKKIEVNSASEAVIKAMKIDL